MRNLLAIALLATVANPDTASCRVSPRPTDWSEVRVMPGATTRPTSLVIDECDTFTQTIGFEQVNPLNLVGCRWSVVNLGIVVEISTEPTFATLLVPPTTIMLPDVAGRVGPYDGVIDFAGSSGQTVAQSAQANSTVTIPAPSGIDFTQPWPMYVRTRTLPYVQNSNAGAMVFQMASSAGVGVVVTYLP